MTDAVIIHKTLLSAFKAKDTKSLWEIASVLCTNSFLYSMSCHVPAPASLFVWLVIVKVN